MSVAREQLRRISASDDECLCELMAPNRARTRALGTNALGTEALDRRVRALVRLAALVMVEAPTTSLRVEVERAQSNGATDAGVAQAFFATARTAGSARLVSVAPRVGQALGFDMDVEDLDEP